MQFSKRLRVILTATMIAVGTGTPVHAESVLFLDEFDKPFLADEWQIRNDSADMRALDSGRLAIVTETGRMSQGKAKNVLVLKAPLKENNADVSATMRVDFQQYGSNWENRALGGIVLEKSKDDYLLFYVVNFRAGYDSDSGPHVFFAKRQGGKGGPILSRRLMGMKQGPVEYH